MKIFTIAYFEMKKIFRDWRLVLIVASQPIVIAALVGLMAYQKPTDVKIGIVDQTPGIYSQMLKDELVKIGGLKIIDYDSIDQNEIKKGALRGFVQININDKAVQNSEVTFYNDPSGRYISYIVEPEIQMAVATVSKKIATNTIGAAIRSIPLNQIKIDPVATNTIDVTPFDLKFTDYYGSSMMVVMIILVVVNLSAVSISNERAQGTFERLFVTPYKKSTVIFGKALALFAIGVFVAVIGNLSLYLMFHAIFANIYLIALIDILVVATSVTLGLLISSITYTVVESVQLAMYLFFVSVLTTGVFSPIESTHRILRDIIKFVPFYYAVDASRRVNMLNADWSQIANNVYILFGSFIVFLALSILLLRREAK